LGSLGLGSGTYTLSGGVLAVAGTANIGLATLQQPGSGTFIQSGGAFTAASLSVGNGSYSLSNGATLNVSGDETIGDLASHGFYTQTGGSNSAGSFTLGNRSATGGTATISGGTLNVA